MSDYLGSLATKNLSSQERLRPLPRARFEPSPPPGVEPGMAELLQESEEQPGEPASDDTAFSSPRLGWDLSRLLPPQPPSSPAPDSPLKESGPAVSGVPAPWRAASLRPVPPAGPAADQHYRGRLDNPPALRPEPETKPVRKSASIAPELVAPQVSPAIPPATSETKAVSAPEPLSPLETPGRRIEPRRPAPDREADRLTERAQGLPADPRPERRGLVLERIIERTLVRPISPVDRPPQATDVRTVSPPLQPIPPPSPSHSPEPAVQPLRPIVPPLPDFPVRDAAPQPTPTINVTIGRIEVRATPGSASPRRPSPQPRLMSLADYLRSRANGERR